MELKLTRTDPGNADFLTLVTSLDKHLQERDGDEHAFYAQHNKSDTIKYVIVAYDQDTACGCGAIRSFSEDAMEVKRMYVAESYRNKGIATTILRALEDWCRELKFEICILETGKNQPEAINLYTRNGYKVMPGYGKYVDVNNSVCFRKEL